MASSPPRQPFVDAHRLPGHPLGGERPFEPPTAGTTPDSAERGSFKYLDERPAELPRVSGSHESARTGVLDCLVRTGHTRGDPGQPGRPRLEQDPRGAL